MIKFTSCLRINLHYPSQKKMQIMYSTVINRLLMHLTQNKRISELREKKNKTNIFYHMFFIIPDITYTKLYLIFLRESSKKNQLNLFTYVIRFCITEP